MFCQKVYYVLEAFEAYVVFLGVLGTWRLAKSPPVKGSIVDVNEYKGSEETYKPINDLSPTRIIEMYRWFVSWKSEPKGVSDLVILKRQFNWGVRFLMASIVLKYILSLINV